MKLHSVNPTAYGPGSTDVLVTLEKDNGQLQNVPLYNAVGLQAQYAANDKKAQDQDAKHSQVLHQLKADYDLAVQRASTEHDKARVAITTERTAIDQQARAAAEAVLAKPEVVASDKQK